MYVSRLVSSCGGRSLGRSLVLRYQQQQQARGKIPICACKSTSAFYLLLTPLALHSFSWSSELECKLWVCVWEGWGAYGTKTIIYVEVLGEYTDPFRVGYCSWNLSVCGRIWSERVGEGRSNSTLDAFVCFEGKIFGVGMNGGILGVLVYSLL